MMIDSIFFVLYIHGILDLLGQVSLETIEKTIFVRDKSKSISTGKGK